MSTAENKAIARRWFEDGFNGHNLDVFGELAAEDFVQHTAVTLPGMMGDREGNKQTVAMVFAAFPDWRVSVEDMIAEGDKVVTRYTEQGTQQGAFMGIPATGKTVTITGIEIMRCADGKIAEQWIEGDALGMMQQLGVIPVPGHAPS